MTARWLKLTVAYDGTAYSGWQFQPDKPTIQGTLEATWQRLTQESLRVTAAGRTDAGVHAYGQVVGLVTQTRLTNEDLHRGMNALLPNDIAVRTVEDASDRFHATYDAIGKRYRYHIHNDRSPSVFNRDFAWHFPQLLDATAMHRAGQGLLGRHDFSSFETAGSERPHSIRTIHELTVVGSPVGEFAAVNSHPSRCDRPEIANVVSPRLGRGFEVDRDVASIQLPAEPGADILDYRTVSIGSENPKRPPHAFSPSLITIDVAGDGFLYNMVRTIVGTLIEVGIGKRDVTWPAEVLALQDRRRAGQTAPPHGLFLVHVDY